MTMEEIKKLKVKILGYTEPTDEKPLFCIKCRIYEALDLMKSMNENYPEESYRFDFYMVTENDACTFLVSQDLEYAYIGRDNKYPITADMLKEALGIEVKKRTLEELLRTLNGKTRVTIIGFPDPLNVQIIDYYHHCSLKETLYKMNKHLDELNLDEKGRLYYDFSVLLYGDESGHRLIYSYNGDREIRIQKEFEDILAELGIKEED